jgi:polar amino acid transport system substrate-binding protein
MNMHAWSVTLLTGLFLLASAGAHSTSSAEAKAALAPAGKLRVAFFSAPIYGVKDPATGNLKGLGVDLGTELAKRLGVPFEPVPYRDLAELIESAKDGKWDVALSTVDAKRAEVLDFSNPYLLVEQGYLVRAGVSIATMSDVDKAGIRVGIVAKSQSANRLSEKLKNAKLVTVSNLTELEELLTSNKVEAIAIGKTFLYRVSAKLPGSRVLDGSIVDESVSMGVVKGRNPAALAYVNKFIEDAKAGGLVKTAIERDKLKGVAVAPAGK